MFDSLPSRDLVLVGAGHTNAHILRMWRMHAIPDVRLTVVTPYASATYSGMLPGTLAGLYERDEMEIDLYRLAASSGARLIVAEAIGLDPVARRIELRDRPPIRYDICSIGIGSVPADREIQESDPAVLGIKPMATFLDRLDDRLEVLRSKSRLRIHVVGAGAAGVEVSLCLDARLRARGIEASIEIVDSGSRILNGYSDRLVDLVQRELDARKITVRREARATAYRDGELAFARGIAVPSDLVLWAVRAAAPPVLDGFDLPKDEHGFLAVRPTLRTTADYPVFVVGDTAAILDRPVPKAGVYAVREGPILWDNIRRLFESRDLVEYEPQRDFLSLLAFGDGRAVGQYRGFAAAGEWVWQVKDHIDRSFMNKHQQVEPMTEKMAEKRERARKKAARATREIPAMRCRGCGGKVGASVLDEALSRLDIPASPHVRAGLDAPDDAAILASGSGLDVVSVDFFQTFLDDPYLVGRVAALHALSDLYATGSDPAGALAIVTVPEGPRDQQTELLHQLLAGGLRELRAAGATLLGGHTTEAMELTIGYTVLGRLDGRRPFAKGALETGDHLVVTKPIGTATILAGLPLCESRAPWIEAMLESMLVSNAEAARLARDHHATGVTDITGFGLGGHLLEMLEASGRHATLRLADVPLLDGFAELTAQGVKSSLDKSNREHASRFDTAHPGVFTTAPFAALFDPQTAGGLLVAVKPERADALVRDLRAAGCPQAAIVGTVGEASEEPVVRVEA